MEYTEDSLLNLELKSATNKGKRKKFTRKVYKHKFIIMIIISLIILSSVNMFMIYNFLKILQNI